MELQQLNKETKKRDKVMRKIDDEKIVNKFNETKDYDIKTSSIEILNLFKAQEEVKEKETPKREHLKKKYVFGGIGLSVGAIAICSLALFFVMNNGGEQGNVNPPVLEPITSSNVLGNELLTLSSFNSYGENTVNNRLALFKKSKSILKETDFEKIVNDYDSIQGGILNILNKEENIKVELQKEINFVYEHVTYRYCDNYYSYIDDFATPFMSFYYNDLSEVNFSTEFSRNDKYLVKLNDSYYDCYIAQESEIEEDEMEEEIKILCTNEQNNEFILIEKENEYEGREVENSYSISYFSSLSDFERENFDYTLTYDLEKGGNKEELEISVETPLSKSEFQNISLKNNNPLTYEFLVEYENEIDDIEVEDLLVTLAYENDQRIYTSDRYNYQIVKK